jgi:hypothetical protein
MSENEAITNALTLLSRTAEELGWLLKALHLG